MATLQGSAVPRVKLEPPDQNIKPEPADDSPSSYVEEDDDIYEDTGDLDFSQAQQPLWLSHIPRTLWEALSKLQDDDEMEIGTIRVEGPESNPSRVCRGPFCQGHPGANSRQVSMKLVPIKGLENEPKEYILSPPPIEKMRARRPGQAMVFSEKDLPGYKPRPFSWDDIDEEGNPGQGRSFLYERHKRELKKKENKGRYTPYTRRPIPKQTAITGTVAKEFEAIPVKNDEYFELENKKAAEMLKPPERDTAIFATGDEDPAKKHVPLMSLSDKANVLKVRDYLCYTALITTDPPRMHKLGDKHKRRTAPRVSRNMCSLTSLWTFSDNTEFGVYGISRPRSISQKHTCVKRYLKSRLCGKRETSMASGNSRMNTRVTPCCLTRLEWWLPRLKSPTWTNRAWMMKMMMKYLRMLRHDQASFPA